MRETPYLVCGAIYGVNLQDSGKLAEIRYWPYACIVFPLPSDNCSVRSVSSFSASQLAMSGISSLH